MLAIALVIASGVGVLVMSLTAIEALQETATPTTTATASRTCSPAWSARREHLADAHARDRRRAGRRDARRAQRRARRRGLRGARDRPAGVGARARRAAAQSPALRAGPLPALGAPTKPCCPSRSPKRTRLGSATTLRAIINGRWRELTVVGVALSPEYVYTIGPGALMPDDRRFGVLWMGREALQAAFDLDGAFNDVMLALLRGTEPECGRRPRGPAAARYGGIGAYARADQLSNWFLMNEIDQLATLATILPTVFLAVAAFLTNMVLARLVAVERSEIGLLKAFGYRNRAIAWHYVKLVLGIGAVGIAARLVARLLARAVQHADVRGVLPLPVPAVPPGPAASSIAAAVSWSRRCSARSAPCARRPRCRRPRPCARRRRRCSGAPLLSASAASSGSTSRPASCCGRSRR